MFNAKRYLTTNNYFNKMILNFYQTSGTINYSPLFKNKQ